MSISLYRSGTVIDDLFPGVAACMVYGICRERYSKEDLEQLESDLLILDLQARDPEAAQAELNRRAMQD